MRLKLNAEDLILLINTLSSNIELNLNNLRDITIFYYIKDNKYKLLKSIENSKSRRKEVVLNLSVPVTVSFYLKLSEMNIPDTQVNLKIANIIMKLHQFIVNRLSSDYFNSIELKKLQ